MPSRPLPACTPGFASADPAGAFQASLEAVQQPLLAYIISLTGNSSDSYDILQETNLFLWERRDEFEAGTSFKAWACRVAYFKTLAFRRDSQRRGEEFFREDILLHLAAQAPEQFADGDEKLEALRACLEGLRGADRELLMVRYASPDSLADFAHRIGRSAPAVHTAICRIRGLLRQCVERRLKKHR
jgi:RNA polymerase sigma-70 factor (ECF subfamily)